MSELYIPLEKIKANLETLKEELMLSTIDIASLSEDEKKMRYLIENFGYDIYFEGLIATALIPDNLFSKYQYFFSYLSSHRKLMEYIFLFYAFAALCNHLDNESENFSLEVSKGQYEVQEFFIDLLLKVYQLKLENKPKDFIIKQIKKACANYSFFPPYVDDPVISKVSKDCELYLKNFIYFLKQASLLYLKKIINDSIYFSKLNDERALQDVSKVLTEIQQFINLKDELEENTLSLEDIIKNKNKTLSNIISTGIEIFDGLFEFGRGYRKKTFTVITGASGIGKSKFVTYLGAQALKQGFKVLHIISENDPDETQEDYLSTLIGKKFDILKDKEIYKELNEKYNLKNVKIISFKPREFTTSSIKSLLTKLIYQGFSPDVLIIDSINLMKDEKSSSDRFSRGENIAEDLFFIAREYDLAVIATLQFNRQGIRQSKGSMKLKDDDSQEYLDFQIGTSDTSSLSYAILNYAHQFITLNQNFKEMPKNFIRIYVEKIRRGISNVLFPIYFDKGNMIIRELTNEEIINNYSEKIYDIYNKLKKIAELNKQYNFDLIKEEIENLMENIYNEINEEDEEDEEPDIIERLLGISKEELKEKDPESYVMLYDDEFIRKNVLQIKAFGINKTLPPEEQERAKEELKEYLESFGYIVEKDENGMPKIVGRNSVTLEEFDEKVRKIKEEVENKKNKEKNLKESNFIEEKDIKLLDENINKNKIDLSKNSSLKDEFNKNEQNLPVIKDFISEEDSIREETSQKNNKKELIGLIQDKHDYGFEEMIDKGEIKISFTPIEDENTTYYNINDNEKNKALQSIKEFEEDLKNGLRELAEEERITLKVLENFNKENNDKEIDNKNELLKNNINETKNNNKEINKSINQTNNKEKENNNKYKYNIFDELNETEIIAVIGNPYIKSKKLVINGGVLNPINKQTNENLSKILAYRLFYDKNIAKFEYKNVDIYFIASSPIYIPFNEKNVNEKVKKGYISKILEEKPKYIQAYALKPDIDYLRKSFSKFKKYLDDLNTNKNILIIYDNKFKKYIPIEKIIELLKELAYDKLDLNIYLCNGEKIKISEKKNNDYYDFESDIINYNVVCIPTNGYINKKKQVVMGAGIAKVISRKLPMIKEKLAELIKENDHIVQVIETYSLDNKFIKFISFPVKPKYGTIETNEDLKEKVIARVRSKFKVGNRVPGFYCKADPEIIFRSCNELANLIEKEDLNNIALPLPGTGNGELTEEESIKLIVNSKLRKFKDRIVVFTKSWKKTLEELFEEYSYLVEENFTINNQYDIFKNIDKFSDIIVFSHGYVDNISQSYPIKFGVLHGFMKFNGLLPHLIYKKIKSNSSLSFSLSKYNAKLHVVISSPSFVNNNENVYNMVYKRFKEYLYKFRKIPGYMLKYDKELMKNGLNNIYELVKNREKIAIVFENHMFEIFETLDEFIEFILNETKFKEIPDKVYITNSVIVKLEDYINKKIKEKSSHKLIDKNITSSSSVSENSSEEDKNVIYEKFEYMYKIDGISLSKLSININKLNEFLTNKISKEDKKINVTFNDITQTGSLYSIYHWHKDKERVKQLEELKNKLLSLGAYLNGNQILRIKTFDDSNKLIEWSEKYNYKTYILPNNFKINNFKNPDELLKLLNVPLYCIETNEIIKLT